MPFLAVGVSPGRFSDGPSLPFAAGDARRFAALGPAGLALTDQQATREAVGQAIDHLSPEGPCLVVLVAPVIRDGQRVLVRLADGLVDPVELLEPLWRGSHDQVIFALDLGRGLDGSDPELAGCVETLMERFDIRAGRTLLLSDDGRNVSHVSGEIQAGIWAYHLAQAFEGRDARSREEDGTLTAGSLRSYLSEEIAASLRQAFSDDRAQTPLVLAHDDLEVLAGPPAEAPVQSPAHSTKDIEIRGEELIPVKQLGGFQKSIHTAPGDTLDSSREWVLRLGEPNLKAELEQTVTRLRSEFGYTRRQIRPAGPTHGGASILTPDFAVHFNIAQSTDKPQVAVLRRVVSEFRDVEMLGREALAAVFPKGFTQLFQPFHTPADIESLIDMLEAARLPHVKKIDYPTDLAYCELMLAGFAGRVRIEPGGVTVVSDGPLGPGELARGYGVVRGVLG